jgi:hypothetical protein
LYNDKHSDHILATYETSYKKEMKFPWAYKVTSDNGRKNSRDFLIHPFVIKLKKKSLWLMNENSPAKFYKKKEIHNFLKWWKENYTRTYDIYINNELNPLKLKTEIRKAELLQKYLKEKKEKNKE